MCSCPTTGAQAEKASKQRKWAEAEDDYIKALWVDPTANAVNLALWLGLCQAQLALKKGAEAVKSCTAVRAWARSPRYQAGAAMTHHSSSQVAKVVVMLFQMPALELYLQREAKLTELSEGFLYNGSAVHVMIANSYLTVEPLRRLRIWKATRRRRAACSKSGR